MASIQCERCRRQMSDDAENCPHCDAPNPAVSRQGPRPDESSPWERKVPLALLVFGLLILGMHGFEVAGIRGSIVVLGGKALRLAFELSFTLGAMFITASLLNINFGEFGTAVLKIAALSVFAAALLDVGAVVGQPILRWVVSLGASLFLYGKVFDLNAAELVGVVLIVAVVRALLILAFSSLIGVE